MTYQPLQFDAAPRPYRLGNDQLRRYNRVRAGQRTQGRVNIAIDVVTILLIVSVSAIVAIVELSSMPDTILEKLAGLALTLLLSFLQYGLLAHWEARRVPQNAHFIGGGWFAVDRTRERCRVLD